MLAVEVFGFVGGWKADEDDRHIRLGGCEHGGRRAVGSALAGCCVVGCHVFYVYFLFCFFVNCGECVVELGGCDLRVFCFLVVW